MSATNGTSIMHGMTKFLSSRKEKRGSHDKHRPHLRDKSKTVTPDLYRVFSHPADKDKKADKEQEKKIKALTQRLHDKGIGTLEEPQIKYALQSIYAAGDSDKALDLLVMFEESVEGIVRGYDPNLPLLGAVNRQAVTCYLDSLLFAMFARLHSFEGMLFGGFDDEPRRKLMGLIRLWVNMLRSGKLITPDITKHLQEAIAECGWEDAAETRQQDASEAFTFITDQLGLPLLTLKVDLYHAGKEDTTDDHKFVNERLLEVAIPPMDETSEEEQTVTLENCLETYFNNKIEVKRYLQRRNTQRSMKPSEAIQEKEQDVQIEAVELPDRPSTPPPMTPTSTSSSTKPRRPSIDKRHRTDSIFTEKLVGFDAASEKRTLDDLALATPTSSRGSRQRALSIRREVMMPAWQFFSLIPWYTDNAPKSDAQVAAQFAAERPVLGICLKRYTVSPDGTPLRLNTHVDIPLEIALPHFVSDENMGEDGPLFGNFKLCLQSVVCHRGVTTDSGHYVSLVRGNATNTSEPSGIVDLEKRNLEELEEKWMLFDDLATPRVSKVDIHEALQRESPYLLFYQIQPIDEDLASRGDPPSYEDANCRHPTSVPSMESMSAVDSESSNPDRTQHRAVDPSLTLTSANGDTTENLNTSCETAKPDLRGSLPPYESNGDNSSRGPSIDLSGVDDPRGRKSTSSNRGTSSNRNSIAFEEGTAPPSSYLRSNGGATAPTTPSEEKRGFIFGGRRGSKVSGKGSKSRPSSQSGENRLSATLTNLLTGRMSKTSLNTEAAALEKNGTSGANTAPTTPAEEFGRTLDDAIPEHSLPPEYATVNRIEHTQKDENTPKPSIGDGERPSTKDESGHGSNHKHTGSLGRAKTSKKTKEREKRTRSEGRIPIGAENTKKYPERECSVM